MLRETVEIVKSMWSDSDTGTPEQVAEKVQGYVDLGCCGFVPWCSDFPETESIRLFAEHGHPQLPLNASHARVRVRRAQRTTSDRPRRGSPARRP